MVFLEIADLEAVAELAQETGRSEPSPGAGKKCVFIIERDMRNSEETGSSFLEIVGVTGSFLWRTQLGFLNFSLGTGVNLMIRCYMKIKWKG